MDIGSFSSLPDNAQVIAEWIDWMQAQGLAERTVELYTYAVHKLWARPFVRGQHLLGLSSTEIVAHLAMFGSRASSKAMHRRGLRTFYRWAVLRGYRDDDPTKILDGAKRPHRDKPQPFTESELTRLAIAAAWRSPRRGWAVLACYALGTRRSELTGIREQDIDWESRRLRVIGKGDKPRSIPINELAETSLRELLALARPNAYGTVLGIGPNQFTAWVNQAAQDCGFPWGRKRRSHTLRSTYASHLGAKGVPAAVIRDLLGHDNIATTNDYLGVYEGDDEAAANLIDGSPYRRGETG